MADPLTADAIIAHLKLKPHPEGGWFRETFRDKPATKAGRIPRPFSFCSRLARSRIGIASMPPSSGIGMAAPGFDFAGLELAPEDFVP